MSTKAQLEAQLAAMIAQSPAATTVQTAVNPALPAWVVSAQQAIVPAPPKVKAPEPPKAPRPLTTEVLTRVFNPTTAKPGAVPFEPFKVLHISNGANGKFNRSASLDSRYLRAVAIWLGSTAGQAFMKTGSL